MSLRWRLARWVAPVDIIPAPGAPTDKDEWYLYQRNGHFATWWTVKSIDIDIKNAMRPAIFDGAAFQPPQVSRGTFSGEL